MLPPKEMKSPSHDSVHPKLGVSLSDTPDGRIYVAAVSQPAKSPRHDVSTISDGPQVCEFRHCATCKICLAVSALCMSNIPQAVDCTRVVPVPPGTLSFHPMVQCAVHALKGIACSSHCVLMCIFGITWFWHFTYCSTFLHI